MKTIKEALISLYSEILESYQYSEHEFNRMRNSMTFYEFIEIKFQRYRNICSEIDSEELNKVNEGVYQAFTTVITHDNFDKFIIELLKTFIEILQLAYKGNLYKAYHLLGELMEPDPNNPAKLPIYEFLTDNYQNSIKKDIEENRTLYRMRDVNKNDSRPDNCWHIPFALRKFASFQRYNMYGIPCLYLADSLATSNAEIGELEDNKNRWFAEFSTNSFYNRLNDLAVFDFTIPTVMEISKENSINYLFDWLITYPLRLLCSVKVLNKGNFCEEYIFPQLVFHWVYFLNNDCMNGFKYSSTKNPGGVNYVFPAKYETPKPPTLNDRQISEKLEKIFVASEPILYKEGRSRKRYSIEITEL